MKTHDPNIFTGWQKVRFLNGDVKRLEIETIIYDGYGRILQLVDTNETVWNYSVIVSTKKVD